MLLQNVVVTKVDLTGRTNVVFTSNDGVRKANDRLSQILTNTTALERYRKMSTKCVGRADNKIANAH